MSTDDSIEMGADALARLLDFDGTPPMPWSTADLPAMLKHQLAVPLVTELTALDPGCLSQLEELNRTAQPPLRTFEDLLHHPAPPLRLLELTKRFAKAHAADGELLPRGITTLLYFASILVARLRCRQRITSLEDRQLARSLRQLLKQSWIDPRTRELLESGARQLESEAIG